MLVIILKSQLATLKQVLKFFKGDGMELGTLKGWLMFLIIILSLSLSDSKSKSYNICAIVVIIFMILVELYLYSPYMK